MLSITYVMITGYKISVLGGKANVMGNAILVFVLRPSRLGSYRCVEIIGSRAFTAKFRLKVETLFLVVLIGI